jgi:hypothetical protein
MPCRRGTVKRGRARRQRAHTRPAPLDLNYRHTHARPRQSYRQHYAAMCSLSWTKLPGDHRPCQQRVAAPRDTIITVDAKFKRSLRLSIRIGDKNSGAVNVQQTGSAACLVVMSQTSCRLVRAPTNKSIYLPMFS